MGDSRAEAVLQAVSQTRAAGTMTLRSTMQEIGTIDALAGHRLAAVARGRLQPRAVPPPSRLQRHPSQNLPSKKSTCLTLTTTSSSLRHRQNSLRQCLINHLPAMVSASFIGIKSNLLLMHCGLRQTTLTISNPPLPLLPPLRWPRPCSHRQPNLTRTSLSCSRLSRRDQRWEQLRQLPPQPLHLQCPDSRQCKPRARLCSRKLRLSRLLARPRAVKLKQPRNQRLTSLICLATLARRPRSRAR